MMKPSPLSGTKDSLASPRGRKDMMEPTGVDDMVSLVILNEENILYNLLHRYKSDTIYTYVGPILISINPYKPLPIYNDEHIELYKGYELGERPPHIFAIAESAYRNMLRNGRDQAVIISGESGAGKTEATKLVLNYLTAVSGDSHGHVQQQIIESNPVLEAFGNAKTIRNDNSSRFGKFFEIQFNRSGKIVGANIEKCARWMEIYLITTDIGLDLLEKSRVVQQAKNERNYHIFYQLCAGLSYAEKAPLKLRSAIHYNYLNRSGCLEISGISDAHEFHKTVEAMNVIGLSSDEQMNMFRVLAAILHLGNIGFRAAEATAIGGEAMAQLDGPDSIAALKAAESLLECHHAGGGLHAVLTTRSISAGGQTFVKPLSAEQAGDTRDALAKALYNNLFTWLVDRVNASIHSSNMVARKSECAFRIGVLDIFGFEIFDRNGYEQFLINYANEKLQRHYNMHIFEEEQREYIAEGLSWDSPVEFEDNSPCLELIERKPLGILSLLDEECTFPRGTNRSFLEKIESVHGAHEYFEKVRSTIGSASNSQNSSAASGPSNSSTSLDRFGIKHYAGSVVYAADGFLEKNKDTLHVDLTKLLRSSRSAFVRGLTSLDSGILNAATLVSTVASLATSTSSDEISADVSTTVGTEPSSIGGLASPQLQRSGSVHFPSASKQPRPSAMTVAAMMNGSAMHSTASVGSLQTRPASSAGAKPGSVSAAGPRGPSGPLTVSNQFRAQLKTLLDTLNTAVPHYIRCIKPNAWKQSASFDADFVLSQLRYTGVMNTIRIRRQGFPVRYLYAEFVRRYAALSTPANRTRPSVALSQTGNGALMVRRANAHSTQAQPQAAMNDRSRSFAILRALGIERDQYQAGKTKLFFRDIKIYYELERLLAARRDTAASVIQRVFRGVSARAHYRQLRRAALVLQAAVRKRAAQFELEYKRSAVMTIQSAIRRRHEEKYYHIYQAGVVALQAAFRRCLVRLSNQRHQAATAPSLPQPKIAAAKDEDMQSEREEQPKSDQVERQRAEPQLKYKYYCKYNSPPPRGEKQTIGTETASSRLSAIRQKQSHKAKSIEIFSGASGPPDLSDPRMQQMFQLFLEGLAAASKSDHVPHHSVPVIKVYKYKYKYKYLHPGDKHDNQPSVRVPPPTVTSGEAASTATEQPKPHGKPVASTCMHPPAEPKVGRLVGIAQLQIENRLSAIFERVSQNFQRFREAARRGEDFVPLPSLYEENIRNNTGVHRRLEFATKARPKLPTGRRPPSTHFPRRSRKEAQPSTHRMGSAHVALADSYMTSATELRDHIQDLLVMTEENLRRDQQVPNSYPMQSKVRPPEDEKQQLASFLDDLIEQATQQQFSSKSPGSAVQLVGTLPAR